METVPYPRGVMSCVDSQDITMLLHKLSVNLGYESIWNTESNKSVCVSFTLKFHRPKNPTTWHNATVRSVLSSVWTWKWMSQILQKLVSKWHCTTSHNTSVFSRTSEGTSNLSNQSLLPECIRHNKIFTVDNKTSELKENIELSGEGMKSVQAELTKSKFINYTMMARKGSGGIAPLILNLGTT